jgi:hypothetical protein
MDRVLFFLGPSEEKVVHLRARKATLNANQQPNMLGVAIDRK